MLSGPPHFWLPLPEQPVEHCEAGTGGGSPPTEESEPPKQLVPLTMANMSLPYSRAASAQRRMVMLGWFWGSVRGSTALGTVVALP